MLPGAGPHLRRAGRRLPSNLDLAQEVWAGSAFPGLARDRDTQAGATAGGTGGWARGLRPLTMVETRFSRFLQKLGFTGAGHQYEPLERGELETLVSLGDPARGKRLAFPAAPFTLPYPATRPGPRTALLQPALLPLVLERSRLHSNANSRFCSGPGAPATQRSSASPFCGVESETETG